MKTLKCSAILNTRVDGGFSVEVVWSTLDGSKLDRPSTGGFGLAAQHGKLAARLVAAINAGAVYTGAAVVRDINGASYVSASCQVLGRTMNADLKRLGF